VIFDDEFVGITTGEFGAVRLDRIDLFGLGLEGYCQDKE